MSVPRCCWCFTQSQTQPEDWENDEPMTPPPLRPNPGSQQYGSSDEEEDEEEGVGLVPVRREGEYCGVCVGDRE